MPESKRREGTCEDAPMKVGYYTKESCEKIIENFNNRLKGMILEPHFCKYCKLYHIMKKVK